MEVIRDAKLFEAGAYPDKGLTASESDLDAMVAAFARVGSLPVRVQHGVSPWDGKMGRVVSVWRVGKELMGKIAWPSEVWAFLCAMGTKALSVGLSKAKELVEVSIVDVPRVLTARCFGDSMPADGVVGFNFEFESDAGGVIVGEFSAEVQAAIKAAEDRGKVAGAAEAKTQFDAQVAPLAKEVADLRRGAAKDTASVKIALWKGEGKLPPACEKFAEAILIDGTAEVTFADGGHMSAADALVQFMTHLPRVVEIPGSNASNDDKADEAAIGVCMAAGMTREEAIASLKGSE